MEQLTYEVQAVLSVWPGEIEAITYQVAAADIADARKTVAEFTYGMGEVFSIEVVGAKQ